MDINETMQRQGPEGVRRRHDNAKRYYKANGQQQHKDEAQEFRLTCLESVEPRPITWNWPGYLARGKLTILCGDPDKAKSQITIDAAARQSTGARWPTGPEATVASTIFLCSEDGVADTVRPRAEAAGADLSKLHVFESKILKNGKAKGFTLQDDLEILSKAVNQVQDVGMIVADALTSYMGKVENSSTSDIRAVLDPVSQWADAHQVNVLGVMHPPKAAQANAIRQFSGSFAYVASARLAHLAIDDPDDAGRKLLLCVKNNIGIKAPGRGYRIAAKTLPSGIVAPYIQWDDTPVDYTADEVLAATASKGKEALERAKEFLKKLLEAGPVEAEEVKKAASAHMVASMTLRRAQDELGIVPRKTGLEGGWVWGLENK
jgi:putative DNA primase/helicase